MEIHAPESPVRSFKDFLIHISIVTLGILIALGLDGLREAIHNRHLVREARENVHSEMGYDQSSALKECSQVVRYRNELQALVENIPILVQQPQKLATQLNVDANSGYFLAANSWQTALSTGVLAHIPTPEVSAYAYAAEGIRRYTDLQTQAQLEESRTKALIMSQTRANSEGEQAATQALLLFFRAQDNLAFVCPQMQGDIDRAYRASAP